jgi:hypothetical protein
MASRETKHDAGSEVGGEAPGHEISTELHRSSTPIGYPPRRGTASQHHGWYCGAVTSSQDEPGTAVGPKTSKDFYCFPIEGCWGPILPFGSCRFGHF